MDSASQAAVDSVEQGVIEEAIAPEVIAIEGITEPTILNYFTLLNAGDFAAVGPLFASDGALHPPFESPIVGPEAISTYLQAEAQGFIMQPRQGTIESLEDGTREVQVGGRVQTPFFSVNVAWRFILNAESEILLVKIKLLASPKELLNLRQ